MASKLILCRTRLEEAVSHLRQLVTSREYDPDVRLRLATALGYIEKAIELLQLDATRGPGGS
jgi:hypothetical protein